MSLGGSFSTGNLILSDSATLAGDAVVVSGLFQWSGGTLASAGLTTAPGSTMAITAANAMLPAVASINGNVTIDNSMLDLNGNLLQLNNANLGGTGTVVGDVVNNTGVLLAGGTGTLGNLTIDGNYSQNSSSAMVVEVFNNGFTTVSDQLTVTGSTQLNGALIIGFTDDSLGLVTSDVTPFDFRSGVSGNFSRVVDAGGNVLTVDFSGGVFRIVGSTPPIPDTVIDDLLAFLDESGQLTELIASNRSDAEIMLEMLLEQEEEDSLLVCK